MIITRTASQSADSVKLMIETVANPVILAQDLTSTHKRAGLSAVVRLKDEEKFCRMALESIQPFFDEIIIVYNDCSDRTPEIVAEFAERYPDRVKAYHYLPSVAPLGSPDHARTPAHSPHSIVFYTNYAVSKASCRIRCMWDGDHVADPAQFGEVTRRLRALTPGSREWWLSPWRLGYWWFRAINLWQADGQLFVSGSIPVAGNKRENGFFPAGRWIRYKRYSRGEYLFTRLLAHRYLGIMFYHLKGIKPDRGIGKYRFDKYPDSLYQEHIRALWTDPELLTLDELRRRLPEARRMPDPEALGIRPLPTRADSPAGEPQDRLPPSTFML